MKRTKNYNMFKGVVGNRPISKKYVEDLMVSITNNNLLDKYPIVVDGDMRVIDGQHRLEAAKRIGVDIYYMVVEDADIGDVRLLNTNQHNWTIGDYVRSYADVGNKHYQMLLTFYREYGLPITNTAVVLGGQQSNNKIKRGAYEVRISNKQAKERLEVIVEASKLYDFIKTKGWVQEINKLFNNHIISPERFLEKVTLYPHPIKRMIKPADIRYELNQVLNYNMKKNHYDVL